LYATRSERTFDRLLDRNPPVEVEFENSASQPSSACDRLLLTIFVGPSMTQWGNDKEKLRYEKK